ncbi:glycosyltransferase family 2 protein [Chryseobacterium indoltheticum]|uniref:glycosyltransferase family 2 protein n=1 Tax=Chryseobacterium indoltheticum TaxID=254 RepID=UPI003F492A40
MVKFSILIAHYNNYDYFVECYNSILNQTHKDFEIVIVDDCSTDDSYQKIVELTKDNTKVKIFRNEENKGVGYTKRRCAEMASGEICGFVDPDDAITENALQISIENHTKDNVVTYSKFHLCDSTLKASTYFSTFACCKKREERIF